MADRPKGYGMTAELADKKAAKYDAQLDLEARHWMEEIVGEPFPTGSEGDADTFHEALKDGTYLCKLVNILEDREKIKFNTSKMAFKMMENIGKFLAYCEEIGCKKTDMFQTVDLYEAGNIPQVINGIHAFSRKVQVKFPDLPSIGPKEATQNKREFTEEQMRAGQNVIGLQMGTNTGASQAGSTPYGAQRQIH